jgi:hypothetical protein
LDTGSKNPYEKAKTDLADIPFFSGDHYRVPLFGGLVFQPSFPAVFH